MISRFRAAFTGLAALAVLAAPAAGQDGLAGMLDDFEWRLIGPANIMGRVTDVEGLPSPSRTFYFAAAAGGIWKTTNNGTTFRQIWDQTRVIAMGDIAIAPSDTMQIWAGTGEEDSRNSISAGGGTDDAQHVESGRKSSAAPRCEADQHDPEGADEFVAAPETLGDGVDARPQGLRC